MDNQVEEIKNRLDVVDIVRGYMKLEKSGTNFRGICPFHREKTPSFFVSPARQLWKCFGCSLGGDMFTFIQQIEGLDFKEALKNLADRAGVRFRSYDPKIRSEKARLYEICEKSCQFFEKQLVSSSLGKEAAAYLKNRKITEESLTNFRLGFAPDARVGLTEFLKNQGYSTTEIFKAGVAVQGSDYGAPGSFDRFRGRIIFPILDLNGQVVGFGGRIFFGKNQVENPKLAKYINTPQTLLYDKSRVLYGLDKAKMQIRKQDSCLLVEGYTDVIMAHQNGFENVVSTSGTSLTAQQLDIIRRYTSNITTAFDMDIAGDSATRRGIDIAQEQGFNVRVIVLPGGKDPAEIIQKNKKGWEKAAEAPFSIGDFYLETALSKYDKTTAEGVRDISSTILPMIKRIPSKIEQSYWVQKLAFELNCSERVIWDDLLKLKESSSGVYEDKRSEGSPVEQKKKGKKAALYERLLLAALKDEACLGHIAKKDLNFLDKNFYSASVLIKLRTFYKKKKPKAFDKGEQDFINEILFQEEIFPSFPEESTVVDEFNECLRGLKQVLIRENLLKLQAEMKQKGTNINLMEKFKKLSVELAKL